MPLTDTRIRQAKPKDKPYKLTDGGSLHLEVRPTGAKLWRLRYRLARKENVFAIGRYPEVDLKAARAERDAAKKIIKEGIHPSHKRKLDRIRQSSDHANTFRAVADEWLERNEDKWTARTYKQRQKALENDVFPHIGSLPVSQVTPAHVLAIVQRVEKRGPLATPLGRRTDRSRLARLRRANRSGRGGKRRPVCCVRASRLCPR